MSSTSAFHSSFNHHNFGHGFLKMSEQTETHTHNHDTHGFLRKQKGNADKTSKKNRVKKHELDNMEEQDLLYKYCNQKKQDEGSH